MHPVAFIALLILFMPIIAIAEHLQGRVIAVHDGDTFTVLTIDHQQNKIRMAEIDAPESRQPYGNKAKQELSNLIFEKR